MRSLGASVKTGLMLRELSLPRLTNENGNNFTCEESLSMMWRVCVRIFPFASFTTNRQGCFRISNEPYALLYTMASGVSETFQSCCADAMPPFTNLEIKAGENITSSLSSSVGSMGVVSMVMRNVLGLTKRTCIFKSGSFS